MADFIVVQKEKEQDLITEIKKQINEGYIPVGNFWEKKVEGTIPALASAPDSVYDFPPGPGTYNPQSTKMMCQSMYKLNIVTTSGGSKSKNQKKNKTKTK